VPAPLDAGAARHLWLATHRSAARGQLAARMIRARGWWLQPETDPEGLSGRDLAHATMRSRQPIVVLLLKGAHRLGRHILSVEHSVARLQRVPPRFAQRSAAGAAPAQAAGAANVVDHLGNEAVQQAPRARRLLRAGRRRSRRW